MTLLEEAAANYGEAVKNAEQARQVAKLAGAKAEEFRVDADNAARTVEVARQHLLNTSLNPYK